MIEVAIGEYGVTVEKLAVAVEEIWEGSKSPEPILKPQLPGKNFELIGFLRILFSQV